MGSSYSFIEIDTVLVVSLNDSIESLGGGLTATTSKSDKLLLLSLSAVAS